MQDNRKAIIKLIEDKMQRINPQIDSLDISMNLKACSCKLGLSSIEIVKLLIELETEFNIEIDKKINSIEEIVNIIIEKENYQDGA